MPRIPDGELSIVEASSFRDYLFLRTLRNQIRNLMTNNTEPIGYLAQLRFYVSIRYRLRHSSPSEYSLRAMEGSAPATS
jgi:hypothetical protein